MVHSTLYDDDILAWSEQQAEALRALARSRRDLPNELDFENIAEEIGDVGRSELHAVESSLRQILVRLIKLALQLQSDSVRHWRGEVVNWQDDIGSRFTPSMRQRLDLDKLWRQAVRQVSETVPMSGEGHAIRSRACPIPLDLLLDEQASIDDLVARVEAEIIPQRPSGR